MEELNASQSFWKNGAILPSCRILIDESQAELPQHCPITTIHKLLKLCNVKGNFFFVATFDDVGHHLEAIQWAKGRFRHGTSC